MPEEADAAHAAKVDGPSLLRHRRLAAATVGALLLVGLWVIAGKPWWPPVTLVGGTVLVRLLRRVLPRVLRYPVAVAGLVGAILLAPQLTAELLVLGAGGVLARIPVRAGRPLLGDTRNRAWLAVAAALVLTSLVELPGEQTRTERRRAAEDAQASALSWAGLLPPTPAQAAHTLLEAIADGEPTICTLTLSPAAAAQLAAATGTPDCPTAVHTLAGRVVDPMRYQSPDHDAVTTTLAADGQIQIVDACHLAWDGLSDTLSGTTTNSLPPPGPQLGRLALTQVLHRGYQIVAFTPC